MTKPKDDPEETDPGPGAGDEEDDSPTVTLPRTEVDALRAKVSEYLDMAQRVQADFSNYQKRVARDRADQAKFLVERLLLDLLPALDAFALSLRGPVTNAAALAEGMKLAEREIFRKLELHGLKRIPTEGEFSPAMHEALMKVETDKQAPGMIVAEMRPGYTLLDKVLRAAQVSVACAPGNKEGGASA